MNNYKDACILSVGTAVPEKILTNSDLEKTLDTSDEWIVKRTGIRTRYIMPEDLPEPAADLGAEAVKKALDKANLSSSDIDTIICATFTPDNFFPSTACGISNRVGCPNVFAFDLSAACSGFLYGVTVAKALISTKQSKTVVVVGSEIISKSLDWGDRGTCILFGDGAGAVVLQETDVPGKGILATDVFCDSSLGDILKLPAWDGKQKMSMNGNEVFKQAVRLMTESTEKSLKVCSMTNEDVDLLIPHQANIRIINSVAKKLNIPENRVVSNVDKYGNTSSASIPLALDEVWDNGKIQDGTVVAFAALGGGITVGSAVVRF